MTDNEREQLNTLITDVIHARGDLDTATSYNASVYEAAMDKIRLARLAIVSFVESLAVAPSPRAGLRRCECLDPDNHEWLPGFFHKLENDEAYVELDSGECVTFPWWDLRFTDVETGND